ncbi:MAG: porin [Acidobacteriota bacterium]
MAPDRFACRALCLLAVIALTLPPSVGAEWRITSDDGESSIKVGFLGVLRADSEDLPNGESAENLFFRRLRLLAGGTLAERWSFFLETDSPNLGKSSEGNKDTGDVFIQDFFVTYTHSQQLKVDTGLILIPLSRNSTQSAATHLASDYGPYSFLQSGPTDSRVGRDYGVQMRGSLADASVEYRLGVFDGNRSVTDDLRFAGRLSYHVFDAETGMFYTGNNLGARRQLSFGVGFDIQDDFQAIGADVFYDQPVGDDGSAFTVQLDRILYDGGDTFISLPEQETLLLEIGYLFGSSRLQPWLQYAERDYDDPARADTDSTFVGVNYRLEGHKRVLRLAYGQLGTDGADDRDVLQLTLQIFQF